MLTYNFAGDYWTVSMCSVHAHVAGQNEIQVKIILTLFDSQFPLSSNPNYS